MVWPAKGWMVGAPSRSVTRRTRMVCVSAIRRSPAAVKASPWGAKTLAAVAGPPSPSGPSVSGVRLRSSPVATGWPAIASISPSSRRR